MYSGALFGSRVLRHGSLGSASNFGATDLDGAKLPFDPAPYFGAQGGGKKLLVNHLIERGLKDDNRQRASNSEHGAKLDDFDFQFRKPLVLPEHIPSLRVGFDNRTMECRSSLGNRGRAA